MNHLKIQKTPYEWENSPGDGLQIQFENNNTEKRFVTCVFVITSLSWEELDDAFGFDTWFNHRRLIQTCHPVVGTGISGGGGEYCKRYCRGRGEVLQKFGKGGSGISFLEN